MERDKLYLGHILKAISDLETYTKGMEFDEFSKTTLTQDGVMRKLEIIGEASKRLSPGFRDSVSEIPWKEICGMRDKLIHDYLGVDLMAVWKTATEDSQVLKKSLEKFDTSSIS
jgi:uncharacterized protein with HEPN domain